MRRLTLAVCLLVPLAARAQNAAIERAIDLKLEAKAREETLKYILSLHDPETGAYRADVNAKPSYRACNNASKAIRYLGGKVQPDREKTAAFILSCYDPKTGTFAEPGGKADVSSTAIGIITAAEYGVPMEKFPKALDYLKENVKTWEEVRIGGAALEAVKEKPDWLAQWDRVADEFGRSKIRPAADGGARDVGSLAAYRLRLGKEVEHRDSLAKFMSEGQRDDGAWGKAGEKASDFETTYRLMRAFMLLKQKPSNPAKLRAYVARHRNADGGYGTEPGKPSNIGGTYFAITILYWLAELEK